MENSFNILICSRIYMPLNMSGELTIAVQQLILMVSSLVAFFLLVGILDGILMIFFSGGFQLRFGGGGIR